MTRYIVTAIFFLIYVPTASGYCTIQTLGRSMVNFKNEPDVSPRGPVSAGTQLVFESRYYTGNTERVWLAPTGGPGYYGYDLRGDMSDVRVLGNGEIMSSLLLSKTKEYYSQQDAFHNVRSASYQSMMSNTSTAVVSSSWSNRPTFRPTHTFNMPDLYIRGALSSFKLSLEDMCIVAARGNTSIIENKFANVSWRFGSDTTISYPYGIELEIFTPVYATIQLAVSSSVQALDFGTIITGKPSSKDLQIAVQAPPTSTTELFFSYSSKTNTNEILTVNGHSLPYKPLIVMPSDKLSRTDTYRVGITSSTAGRVEGLLLVTASVK